ncbi:hypothetical protein X777_13718 [Ooceraea biroi]|uniref:Uncharacterized protein n=1 Tax=Ooceraea biroi TaxID=2015173 RepID=A0A026VXN7_OOCBI|nr:hypothetical protein X777_13718 [Ooceraea biroi]
MSHTQVSAVLQVLRTHPCLSSLPKDCRTLLKTPRTTHPTFNIAGGEYLHLGFEAGILSILQQTCPELIPRDTLMIDCSTDGVTLDVQGKIQMWPIQIRIANIPRNKPEIVGIWRGSSKPTNAQELFQHFVDEVRDVLNREGIIFHNQLKLIKMRCFIADSPARAFVLGHKGHGSIFPCSKCWIRGNWLRRGVVVYRGIQHRSRTDEEYRQKIDGEHHTDSDSVLLTLGMGLITQTVFDYMHIVCLGVVPKINSVFVDGKYNPSLKLSTRLLEIMTTCLQHVHNYCPKEFSRKPQLIKKYGGFKATENRHLLLYTAPAVYYGLINPAAYKHFLLLHSAIRVLVSSSLSEDRLDFAHTALSIFVNRAEDIYGPEFLSYITHCLLHLVDDVRRFGSLNELSMFPYENNMTYFRKVCRKPHQHLQQIINRRFEKFQVPQNINITEEVMRSTRPWVSPVVFNAPLDSRQFQILDTGKFRISVKNQDNTIILQNSKIYLVQSIILSREHYQLAVKEFCRVEDFFDVGLPSSSLGVFRCSVLSDEVIIVDLNEVHSKCFRMPYWHTEWHTDPIVDVWVVAVILHTRD